MKWQLKRMRIQQWSFGKPVRRVATYVKAKVVGFYTINGESLIEFSESNRAEDFIAFLRKIRESNPEKRIVIVLDNFRTHHAKKVIEEGEKLTRTFWTKLNLR